MNTRDVVVWLGNGRNEWELKPLLSGQLSHLHYLPHAWPLTESLTVPFPYDQFLGCVSWKLNKVLIFNPPTYLWFLSCFCLLIFLFREILDLILTFAVTLPFTVHVKLLSIDKFPEACRSTTLWQCFHLILSPHTPKRGAWGQTLAPDPSDRAFKKSKCPQFFGVP